MDQTDFRAYFLVSPPLQVLNSHVNERGGARLPLARVPPFALLHTGRVGLPIWPILALFLAGSAIPASASSQDQPMERYRAAPELSVGDVDGPLALTRVGSIAIVGSRVLVSQPFERVVRVLDADSGELLHEWGSRGDGPGEMRNLSWMGVVGSSVIIVDTGLSRVTTFSPEGTLVSTRRFGLPPPAPPFAFGGWVFHTADENLVAFGDVLASRAEEAPGLQPWRLIDMEGNVLDTLPALAVEDRTVVVRRGGGAMVISRPLHRGDRFAMSVDGSRFVQARDRLGTGLSLAVYDTEDRRAEELDLRVPPVSVPPEEAARMEKDLRRGLEARGATQGMDRRELGRALAAPSWVPAVDELFVTAQGEIWLREPSFASQIHLWRVVGPDGALTAEVEVPDGIVLRDRAGDHLWGFSVDPTFGVTRVVRLRLEPIP